MPLENLEEEGLEKNPNLELAQTKFLLSLAEHKNDAALKNKLMDTIRAESEIASFISTLFYAYLFWILSMKFMFRDFLDSCCLVGTRHSWFKNYLLQVLRT